MVEEVGPSQPSPCIMAPVTGKGTFGSVAFSSEKTKKAHKMADVLYNLIYLENDCFCKLLQLNTVSDF